jgi:type II secretory pathway component PulK
MRNRFFRTLTPALSRGTGRGGKYRRRGTIFIAALGTTVILAGLVLAFAEKMRTEALASANRLSYLQADATEQAAEQWVLAQVDEYTTDAGTITQIPAAGLQVGTGYFWIIQPNPDDDSQLYFGITDECSKLNLNHMPRNGNLTPEQEGTLLMNLPNMTQDVADAMADWHRSGTNPTSDGAEDSYYQSLPEQYDCKNNVYETVEELMLVKGMTPQLLFGYDLNRNGVIDASEQSAGGLNATLGSGPNGSCGIFNYLTAYSKGQIVRGGPNPPTTNVGLINVNTAPVEVLECLPGAQGGFLDEADAEAIVAERSGGDTTGTNWVQSVLSSRATYNLIRGAITGGSFDYSADIVAVSGDGRAFKRVRIVVDCSPTSANSQTAVTPSKIIYRRDLTSYGWPLWPELRTSMQTGQGVPSQYQETSESGL